MVLGKREIKMVEIIKPWLPLVTLLLGAYLGYWTAIRNKFMNTRLDKLNRIYTALNEIIQQKKSIIIAFGSMSLEGQDFAETFIDLEAGEKLTKLCKDLFGDPQLAKDKIYLPRDIQRRIEHHYDQYFSFISPEGLQYNLAAYFCPIKDNKDDGFEDFFDECYIIRDLVEKKVTRLKRFFF